MILKNKNHSQFFFIQNFHAFELKKTDILKFLSKKTEKKEVFQLFPKKLI